MAYSNYLFKIGNYIVPVNKMEIKSYKAKQNTQDLDSKRNEEGVLIRNTLSHKPYKVEFILQAGLTGTELSSIITSIENQFTDAKERKASCSFFYPKSNGYINNESMYLPDIEYTIDYIDEGTVYYDSVRIAAISY